MSETQRYKEAGDWVLRLNAPQSGEQDVAEWLRWCERHAKNVEAFESMQADWSDIVALRQDAAFSTLEEWEPTLLVEQRSALQRWGWRAAAAVAVIALTLGVLVWNSPERWLGSFGDQHISAVAANKTTSLPDGSVLVLRAQAQINMDFGETVRYLALRSGGEAYFKVKRDARRPFVVQAGGLQIQAVGTAFDVRYENGRIRVIVDEGAVSVTNPAGERWRLEADHQLEYLEAHATAQVAKVDARHALRWRDGEFAYDKVALGEVIRDINRYSAEPIVLANDAIQQMPYTGTVFVAAIDDWLEALALKYPVRKRVQADGSVVLEISR